MEQFISEHGGVIVSGIVTIGFLWLILWVLFAVGYLEG